MTASSHAETTLQRISAARDMVRSLEKAALQNAEESGRLSVALAEAETAFRKGDEESSSFALIGAGPLDAGSPENQ